MYDSPYDYEKDKYLLVNKMVIYEINIEKIIKHVVQLYVGSTIYSK